jgi:hypothetical protein
MTSEKLGGAIAGVSSPSLPPLVPKKMKIEIPKLSFSALGIHEEIDPKKIIDDLKMKRQLKE